MAATQRLELDNEGDIWAGQRLVGNIEDRPAQEGHEAEMAELWDAWNRSLDDLLSQFI